MFFNLRDNLFFLYSSRAKLENCEGLSNIITRLPKHSVVWDVGCNVGIYSMHAARLGHQVFAFDLSPRAVSLLMRSARANGLTNVVGIARALTVTQKVYHAPSTACAGNSLREVSTGKDHSMTWLRAVENFGVPNFIKLDIEGGETEFLNDPFFRAWVACNRIQMFVETHNPESQLAIRRFNFSKLSPRNFLVLTGSAP